jgi:hypothetical protein
MDIENVLNFFEDNYEVKFIDVKTKKQYWKLSLKVKLMKKDRIFICD